MTFLLEIENAIKKNLSDAEVYILDPRKDGVHLEALVISPDFSSKTLLQQHRIVMESLKEHFESSLHAFSLKTFTPQAWEKQKQKQKYEVKIS